MRAYRVWSHEAKYWLFSWMICRPGERQCCKLFEGQKFGCFNVLMQSTGKVAHKLVWNVPAVWVQADVPLFSLPRNMIANRYNWGVCNALDAM